MSASAEISRCRHLKINGARCTMPSWKENGLCFEHNFRYQQQLRNPSRPRQGFAPQIPFVWVEDEASVIHNLNLIAQALGNSEIDHRQASVMTCVQRTCLRTLCQIHEQRKAEEMPEPVVLDCVEEDGGQLLIPLAPPAVDAEPIPGPAPEPEDEPATELISPVAAIYTSDPVAEFEAEPEMEPEAELAGDRSAPPSTTSNPQSGTCNPAPACNPDPARTQYPGPCSNPCTSHTCENCEKNSGGSDQAESHDAELLELVSSSAAEEFQAFASPVGDVH